MHDVLICQIFLASVDMMQQQSSTPTIKFDLGQLRKVQQAADHHWSHVRDSWIAKNFCSKSNISTRNDQHTNTRL